ncbi:acyl-CoA thioesterase [Microtetraspora niveoalba]|uniref:acyl-CoA thioesterase n=1 Tax=Microtetraspora niveoalba TaxID=46175 RepID=UPI0008366E8D|nr:thioesterase family protein [Microtetraspora niveoalba]
MSGQPLPDGAGRAADPGVTSAAAPADRRHVFHRQVRFADIDSLGHVNNVRFFDFLEDARLGMLFVDPVREGGRPHQGLVVARHEIDYRRPLMFRPDPVRVETWVTEIKPVRFTLAYEIKDDEQVFVEARSVMVAYDVESARPRRLTEDELAYLKRFSIED